MGSGKTSVSNWFVKEHDFHKLSFAGPLKKACIELTGLDMSHFQDPELKEIPIPGINTTPRVLMQLMATEFIREMIYPDFWIWRMRQAVSKHSHKDLIIDDIRFENEAQFVRDNGGKIVHLYRNFDFDSNSKDHKSEQGILVQEGDYVIHAVDGVELTALMVSDLIM